jgi:hypothetical protein
VSTGKTNGSFGAAGKLMARKLMARKLKARKLKASKLAVAAALFAAVTVAGSAANAGSTRTDLERRQQTMQSSADAASQRTARERETADRQRQLLEYQVRKNNRTQLKMQCKLAGGGNGC